MIVLLNCFTSWSRNNDTTIFSKGEVYEVPDSVVIAIDDLRKVNAKLIELKYEKEINDSLRSVIVNDIKIINAYNSKVNELNYNLDKANKRKNTIKFVYGSITIGALILLIIK